MASSFVRNPLLSALFSKYSSNVKHRIGTLTANAKPLLQYLPWELCTRLPCILMDNADSVEQELPDSQILAITLVIIFQLIK